MPLITNVMGSTAEEVGELVAALEDRPQVAAIELNVSCPNVATGLDIGADPKGLEALLVHVRPLSSRPLIVKLTPNTADVADCAAGAEAGGADAVSLINTLRAVALSPDGAGPWLGGGAVGSGRRFAPSRWRRSRRSRVASRSRSSGWAGSAAAETLAS